MINDNSCLYKLYISNPYLWKLPKFYYGTWSLDHLVRCHQYCPVTTYFFALMLLGGWSLDLGYSKICQLGILFNENSIVVTQYIKLTSWIINLLKAERCRQGQQHSPTHGFSEQFVWEVTATWSYPTNTCWVWLTIHTPESNTLRAISCSQPQHTTICNKVEWGRQITCPTM